MSQTVAGTLVDVLEKIGVKHIFGLIGDSLNPIADAVRQRTGHCLRHLRLLSLRDFGSRVS